MHEVKGEGMHMVVCQLVSCLYSYIILIIYIKALIVFLISIEALKWSLNAWMDCQVLIINNNYCIIYLNVIKACFDAPLHYFAIIVIIINFI